MTQQKALVKIQAVGPLSIELTWAYRIGGVKRETVEAKDVEEFQRLFGEYRAEYAKVPADHVDNELPK